MHWRSKLIHPDAQAPSGFRSLATPIYRGSTVVFERQADIVSDWRQTENGYSYGVYGTPTVLELGARIAEMEGARHSFVVPGGQAAIALIYLSFCRAGSHVLLPYSAYGPNLDLAKGLLWRLNIKVETYDPLIGAGIAELIRDHTAVNLDRKPWLGHNGNSRCSGHCCRRSSPGHSGGAQQHLCSRGIVRRILVWH